MFWKKKETTPKCLYDSENWKPAVRCSICTGEQVAGFQNIHSGEFKEECLIRDETDLQKFKKKYKIINDLEKIY